MPTRSPIQTEQRQAGQRIFLLLFLVSLGIQALIYGVITDKPVIRSDGVGYYLYLPATLVQGDLSLVTMERQEFPGGIPAWTGANHVAGHYVIKYPLGEAIMQAPFFLLARGVALALGLNSVFAWPYQAGAALAGACYFALGGWCTWLLIKARFDQRLATLALLWTVFGTNLLHYATYDAIFSHVYSFSLTAALLLMSGRLANHAPLSTWLWAGLTGGLLVVTRPTNAVFIILLAGDWFNLAGSFRAGLLRLQEQGRPILLALCVAALPVGLQMAYWKFTTGHWVYYAYGEEGFNFARPAFLNVLFSVEKGWFVYLPLVFIAGLGWLAAREKLSGYFPALLLFGGINLWIISSWHDWGYGGSFTTRPLVESSPLVALGLAGAWWRYQQSRWRKTLLLAGSLACTVYTCLLMLGYWMHTLPYSQSTAADIMHCLTLTWLWP